MTDKEAEDWARTFHETYEFLAPSFGYETRKESAVEWKDVPEKNRKLMTAVCKLIISTAIKDVLLKERERIQIAAGAVHIRSEGFAHLIGKLIDAIVAGDQKAVSREYQAALEVYRKAFEKEQT